MANPSLARMAPTLLYVEDEGSIALLFEHILRSRYPATQLYIASTPQRALAYLRRQAPHETASLPDLVILDIELGDESGLDLLETIRNDAELALLRVLFFSSSQSPHHYARAKALQALDFIHKPVRLEAFEKCVDHIHAHAA